MKNRYAVFVAFGLLALASCGGRETESTDTESSAQSTNPHDGTALSMTCAYEWCSGTNAVLACTVVKSTAATDAAAITVAVDGGTAQQVTTIQPQDFTRWGPDDPHATATVNGVTVPVPNGTHTLTICATQEGANGRLSKSACTTWTGACHLT
jgi:hypothetical protein